MAAYDRKFAEFSLFVSESGLAFFLQLFSDKFKSGGRSFYIVVYIFVLFVESLLILFYSYSPEEPSVKEMSFLKFG